MKRIVLVAALLALASGAKAQTVTIVDGGAPFQWRVKPDWMQVSEALEAHVAGNTPTGAVTTVECVLDRNYRPGACTVIEEPPQSSLGQGAMEVAKLYRALSIDEAGQSTLGRGVRLSFAFGGMRY